MKRRNALLLAIVVIISILLSACTAATSVPPTTSEAPTEATAPITETEKANHADSVSAGKSFTNKYGTATTVCAHAGCTNYIASSGDTNCCTIHSAKCLNCGKYIDEDALYCMSCLAGSIENSSANSSGSSHSGSSKSSGGTKSVGKKCHYKEGNTEVCNNSCAPGSNFCSYHKKYLDEIYSSLTGK